MLDAYSIDELGEQIDMDDTSDGWDYLSASDILLRPCVAEKGAVEAVGSKNGSIWKI